MSRKRRKKFWVWLMILGCAAAGALYLKQKYLPTVRLKDRSYVFLYVEHKDLLEDVSAKLIEEGVIKDEKAFEWLADKMQLRENLHPGRYRITNGMNMRQIINLIRYRKEEKVKLSFNSQIHDLEEFVAYAVEKLSISEEELETFFADPVLLDKHFKLKPNNSFAAIVPGTMKVSWAVTVPEFVEQLEERYKKVYTPVRAQRAKKIGYSVAEIQVIASIVQSESSISSEQRKIAGVYINRLRRNHRLEADPTLKYACRNFALQRILDKDKEIDSPYNTYRNKGLPPGPICLVTTQALEATLNFERHNYMFFCARPQLDGYSNFSVTYDQHVRYANEYRRSLDRRGITR